MIQLFLYTSEDGALRPAVESSLKRVYIADLDYNPLNIRIDYGDLPGSIAFEPPGPAFIIAFAEWVSDFGYSYLVCNNGGGGYRAEDLQQGALLNEMAAKSRARTVEAYMQTAREQGVVFDRDVENRLEKSCAILERIGSSDPADIRAQIAMDSLRESMWAGEMAAIQAARDRIERNGNRPDFLFGCNAFGCLTQGDEYTSAFYDIFNYATLPFYYKHFEPEKGKPDWNRLDAMLDWCERGSVVAKGHPLTWFYPPGIPEWLKDTSYENVRAVHEERIRDIVGRYKGRIKYWDVINEAHDFANSLNFPHEELYELTRKACETTKETNPDAISIINTTALWGEYVSPKVGEPVHAIDKMTPLQYAQRCVEEKLDFDAIGLQIYYGHRDLMEIDRMLERFSKIGKELHITEHAFSSRPGKDDNSIEQFVKGQWHEGFTETMQADYLEGLWTIAFSKPYIKAISYWDFSDAEGHFWPFAGLLDEDLRPKESYHRLRELIKRWRGREG